MSSKVLVTGGAGFIGSFIVDRLVEQNQDVRIFDSLEPQVHRGRVPDYLNKEAEFVQGSTLDYGSFEAAFKDVEVVFHEASAVGVGQSMYEISKYVSSNSLGTANLLDILVNSKNRVKKVIVAASMSSYGEGAYSCAKCGVVFPPLRDEKQLKSRKWELVCSSCSSELKPIPTDERKPLHPNSIYAITKANQEQMVLNVCGAYGIPAVSLRYFNVYGPRQSLSNPYTGVAAIFMSRIKNSRSPMIFEDGMQTRDFVSVHDIVQANILAMKSSAANYGIFNVGSGSAVSIKEVAAVLAKVYGRDVKPNVTNKYRKGDVRHCFSDISKITKVLGYSPKVSFEDGVSELAEWSGTAESVDMVDEAASELKSKGLME